MMDTRLNRLNTERRVLVLGGTGHYGREIVRALGSLGSRPRVLSRNPGTAAGALDSGAEIVAGDITDEASLEKALDGMGAVVIAVSAMSRKTARQLRRIEIDGVLNVLRLLEARRISRVVFLSAYDLHDDTIARLKIARLSVAKQTVEAALASSSLNWTVLGCPPTMGLFTEFLKGDRLIAPGGLASPMPTISPLDVGEIAARAALRTDLSGRRFHLCAAEPVSADIAAKILSEILERPISVRAIPMGAMNVGTAVLGLFNPFFRLLYLGLKVFNNFPPSLIDAIPQDSKRLQETFGVPLRTFREEMTARLG